LSGTASIAFRVRCSHVVYEKEITAVGPKGETAAGQRPEWNSKRCRRVSGFSHFSLPGALNAVSDRLIGRASVGINSESPLGLFPGPGWNLEFVGQADLGDLENAVHVFNVPLHKGDEIV